MRKITAVACALTAALSVAVQAESWETDFDKAASAAKAEGKYMLLDFTGSDWCPWCRKLEREVFSQTAFKTYAKDSLVLVLLDFPRSKPQSKEVKKQNEQLKAKYGVHGYPTILILSPAGKLVVETGYKPGGAEAYVEHLKGKIREYEAKQ